jgi:hypothetical protein
MHSSSLSSSKQSGSHMIEAVCLVGESSSEEEQRSINSSPFMGVGSADFRVSGSDFIAGGGLGLLLLLLLECWLVPFLETHWASDRETGRN